jgi:hypothetical protein
MDELHILLVYYSRVCFLTSTGGLCVSLLITYEITPILPELFRVDNESVVK